MFTKAGRVFKPWIGMKEAEDEVKAEKDELLKRIESWRAISDTEFAKYFVELLEEIKMQTYNQLVAVVLGDLEKFRDNPARLLCFFEQRQGRLICLETIKKQFMLSDKQIREMTEPKEEDNA